MTNDIKGIWQDDSAMMPDYSKSLKENRKIDEEKYKEIERLNSLSWEELNKEK